MRSVHRFLRIGGLLLLLLVCGGLAFGIVKVGLEILGSVFGAMGAVR